MTATRDRGSAGIELVISFPLIIVVLLYVAYVGRLGLARLEVNDAAQAAARAASGSLQRHAQRAAEDAANATVTDRGLVCVDLTVDLDLTNHQPDGTVTARVECDVRVADLIQLGVPGTKTLTAEFTDPISKYVATT